MTLPRTITLIRHGESESNLAKHRFEQGAPLPGEAEMMGVHTSERRLTPLGIEQARHAGMWLKEHWYYPASTPEHFYQFYVSPYIRAMETAAHLGVGRRWKPDVRLVERNWGEFDQLPYAERAARFKDELVRRKDHAFFWRPTNGETFQDVFNRLRDLTATLHRDCDQQHTLMVTHGETMWVWRILLERMLPQQLRDAFINQTEQTRIRNCRILQYTREDANGVLRGRLARVRFINPEAPDDPETNLDWQDIEYPEWTPEAMLQYAHGFRTFATAA